MDWVMNDFRTFVITFQSFFTTGMRPSLWYLVCGIVMIAWLLSLWYSVQLALPPPRENTSYCYCACPTYILNTTYIIKILPFITPLTWTHCLMVGFGAVIFCIYVLPSENNFFKIDKRRKEKYKLADEIKKDNFQKIHRCKIGKTTICKWLKSEHKPRF